MFLDSDPEDLSADTQADNDHEFEFINDDNDVATHDYVHHNYDDAATDNYNYGTAAHNWSTSRSPGRLHSALR